MKISTIRIILAIGFLTLLNGCFNDNNKPGKFTIKEWGPQETSLNENFNVQPNGISAIWIIMNGQNPEQGGQVLFNEESLPDVTISNELVTASVPADLLKKSGTFKIEFRDSKTGAVVNIGNFTVHK